MAHNPQTEIGVLRRVAGRRFQPYRVKSAALWHDVMVLYRCVIEGIFGQRIKRIVIPLRIDQPRRHHSVPDFALPAFNAPSTAYLVIVFTVMRYYRHLRIRKKRQKEAAYFFRIKVIRIHGGFVFLYAMRSHRRVVRFLWFQRQRNTYRT